MWCNMNSREWVMLMLKKPSTIQDDRIIFKSLIRQTHCMQYVKGWLSDVEQPNPTRLTTELHRSGAISEARSNMHYLDGIILLIYITFLGKLICEHCKFEQMKRTFCDHTHTFHLIAVVNFDWMFCLSCAAWESQKWSWWLDFIGNSVIWIHNLKLLNTKTINHKTFGWTFETCDHMF